MIKLQNYTPDVYYRESRDFQFIGRLYDLILNYSKTNADLLYSLPLSDNSDDKFIELLALTLGFKVRHKYTAKHLRAICSCFSEILRNKGTIKAVLIACGAIFNSEGIDSDVNYELDEKNSHSLTVFLPPELKDTTLLIDLCDYILPAGMSCNFVHLVVINTSGVTQVWTQDTFKLYARGTEERYAYEYNNDKWSRLIKLSNTEGTDTSNNIVNTGDAIRALIEDRQGIFMNNSIIKYPGQTAIIRTKAKTSEDGLIDTDNDLTV